MDLAQFTSLSRPTAPTPETVSLDDVGAVPRTLAYGYTCNRDTWHAYVWAAEIHVVIYDFNGDTLRHMHGDSLPIADLRPDKRVYPERCDFTFAAVMKARGFPLPFTTWTDSWGSEGPSQSFHGLVLDRDGAPVEP